MYVGGKLRLTSSEVNQHTGEWEKRLHRATAMWNEERQMESLGPDQCEEESELRKRSFSETGLSSTAPLLPSPGGGGTREVR